MDILGRLYSDNYGGGAILLSKELLSDLQKFVENYITIFNYTICEYRMCQKAFPCDNIEKADMATFIKNNKKPSFSKILFKHIDKIGVSDSEIYKKAGIDRRHFSKIRSNPDYHPSKNTAIALSIALELSRKKAEELIGAAGYTLSDSETFDLVIAFCFERKIYDINDVNLALDYFSLKPLAGVIE